jgi:hypothetical protein
MTNYEASRDPWEGTSPGGSTSEEDLTLLAGWDVPQYQPPAVLCIRSVDFSEPLVGRRARFWLTSFDEAGELIALGWRDGLRIVSEVQDLRGQLDQSPSRRVCPRGSGLLQRTIRGGGHAAPGSWGLPSVG